MEEDYYYLHYDSLNEWFERYSQGELDPHQLHSNSITAAPGSKD